MFVHEQNLQKAIVNIRSSSNSNLNVVPDQRGYIRFYQFKSMQFQGTMSHNHNLSSSYSVPLFPDLPGCSLDHTHSHLVSNLMQTITHLSQQVTFLSQQVSSLSLELDKEKDQTTSVLKKSEPAYVMVRKHTGGVDKVFTKHLKCKVEGCRKRYSSQVALRKHIRTCHETIRE